jgi:Glycosyl transferase family 11
MAMIVAKLAGRLGNQMFQYATARSLAARIGTDVKLDTSWIESKRVGQPIRYELGAFELDVQVGNVFEFARLSADDRLIRALQRVRPLRPPVLKVIRERPGGEFVPQVLTARDNVYLDGFWQSAEYFEDHDWLIRRDFTFRSALTPSGATFARDIARSTSVSVHVRRGDYVNSSFMYSLDSGMYERAIEIVTSQVGDVRIFVFSDEPDWCEVNLRFDYPTVVVRHEDDDDHSLEDLHLMSLCDHHVIANSSFSWWGAWLNPRTEKIVVAPRRWFRAPEAGAERRTPRDWIRI